MMHGISVCATQAIENDEHAEVETDENGVEITHLTPLQQSAFRCRKQLGASKDLPALLEATQDELRLREECVIDQVGRCATCTSCKLDSFLGFS